MLKYIQHTDASAPVNPAETGGNFMRLVIKSSVTYSILILQLSNGSFTNPAQRPNIIAPFLLYNWTRCWKDLSKRTAIVSVIHLSKSNDQENYSSERIHMVKNSFNFFTNYFLTCLQLTQSKNQSIFEQMLTK